MTQVLSRATVGMILVTGLALLAWAMTDTKSAHAQPPNASEQMVGANQLYEAGNFQRAAEAYQQLVDQGLRDAALFYNLGNAHYKQGELGLAVLNYRRAERLSPRDGDIDANLEVVLAQTADVLRSDESSTLADFVSARSWLTVSEFSVAVLVLWSLTALSILVMMFARNEGVRRDAGYTVAVAGTLFVVGAASFGGRLLSEDSADEAVILAEKVEVMSGPGDQYVAEFELHAGAETHLIEERGSWARVALPGDELQGWVPASAVEQVALR